MNRFDNKAVAVTGAVSGIGAVAAFQLTEDSSFMTVAVVSAGVGQATSIPSI